MKKKFLFVASLFMIVTCLASVDLYSQRSSGSSSSSQRRTSGTSSSSQRRELPIESGSYKGDNGKTVVSIHGSYSGASVTMHSSQGTFSGKVNVTSSGGLTFIFDGDDRISGNVISRTSFSVGYITYSK